MTRITGATRDTPSGWYLDLGANGNPASERKDAGDLFVRQGSFP